MEAFAEPVGEGAAETHRVGLGGWIRDGVRGWVGVVVVLMRTVVVSGGLEYSVW